MADVMFIFKNSDSAFLSHYTQNSRFNNAAGSLLFWLYDNTFDVLKYSGLYGFALSMCTAPVLMILGDHRYNEVYRAKTVVHDSVISGESPIRKVYLSDEGSTQTVKSV